MSTDLPGRREIIKEIINYFPPASPAGGKSLRKSLRFSVGGRCPPNPPFRRPPAGDPCPRKIPLGQMDEKFGGQRPPTEKLDDFPPAGEAGGKITDDFPPNITKMLLLQQHQQPAVRPAFF